MEENKPFDYLSIWYIKYLRLILQTIAGWPCKYLGEKIPLYVLIISYYLPVQTVALTAAEMHFIIMNYSSLTFLVKGECLMANVLSYLTFVRSCIQTRTKRYGMIMNDYINSFHLIHHRHKGHYFEEMYKTTEKRSKIAAVYYWTLMVTGAVTYFIQPNYNNYRNGYFSGTMSEDVIVQVPVYFSFPGYDPFEHYWLTCAVSADLIYIFTSSFCNLDLLIILMSLQIVGHFVILQNTLKSIPRPKKQEVVEVNGGSVIVDRFDDEENKNIAKILAGCVEHHKMIIVFTDQLSECFGLMFGLNYSVHLVGGCLLLLELSLGGMEALFRFSGLASGMLIQLVMISVMLEILGTQSFKLINIVYAIPWECMNQANKKTMCFLLQRVQTPVAVTSGGMVPVGVTTMAGVMKTTFSYYMFLRTLSE